MVMDGLEMVMVVILTEVSIPKEPTNSIRQLCEVDALRRLTAVA